MKKRNSIILIFFLLLLVAGCFVFWYYVEKENPRQIVETHANQELLEKVPLTTTFSYHMMGKEVPSLIQEFIRAIAVLRNRSGGVVPPAEEWSYSAELAGCREFYPSEQFMQLWQQRPREVNTMYSNTYSHHDEFALYPMNRKPKAIGILVDDLSTNIVPQITLQHWANQKILPIAFRFSNDLDDVNRQKRVQQTVSIHPKRRDLSIYLVGLNNGIASVMASAKMTIIQKLKRVILIDTNNLWDYSSTLFRNTIPNCNPN